MHNQPGSIELVSFLRVCVCVVRAAAGKQSVRVVNQHLVHMKKMLVTSRAAQKSRVSRA